MNPIFICGANTGNMNRTPGLHGVIDIVKSTTPCWAIPSAMPFPTC